MQGLSHLVTLNLQGNSITELEGLQNLPHLQWANLARNGIRVSRIKKNALFGKGWHKKWMERVEVGYIHGGVGGGGGGGWQLNMCEFPMDTCKSLVG